MLWNANASHCAARTRDLDRRLHRLVETNALEHSMNTEPARQLMHAFDKFGLMDGVGAGWL
jgi:hypothetical protein